VEAIGELDLEEEGRISNGAISWKLVNIGLVLAALLVLSQAVQAWAIWHQAGKAAIDSIEAGQLCSVTLTNNQVYYGRFVAASGKYLRVREIYYVQSAVDPVTNQVSNRLVARHKADWHAPQWMVIPLDNVMFVESIGTGSRLAQLIAEDSAPIAAIK
jgi:hypothetical protein